MWLRRSYRALALSLIVAAVVGCGSRAKAPPEVVYPVTGRVTYKNQPVVGADITFHSQDSNRSAFGRTNDNGEYQLTTFNANDGAVAGKHGVTITKFAEAPAAAASEGDVESEDYQPPGANQSTDPQKPKNMFPANYGSQQTSGLMAIVNTDKPNVVNFDLN